MDISGRLREYDPDKRTIIQEVRNEKDTQGTDFDTIDFGAVYLYAVDVFRRRFTGISIPRIWHGWVIVYGRRHAAKN